jgi:hypothetical protein
MPSKSTTFSVPGVPKHEDVEQQQRLRVCVSDPPAPNASEVEVPHCESMPAVCRPLSETSSNRLATSNHVTFATEMTASPSDDLNLLDSSTAMRTLERRATPWARLSALLRQSQNEESLIETPNSSSKKDSKSSNLPNTVPVTDSTPKSTVTTVTTNFSTTVTDTEVLNKFDSEFGEKELELESSKSIDKSSLKKNKEMQFGLNLLKVGEITLAAMAIGVAYYHCLPDPVFVEKEIWPTKPLEIVATNGTAATAFNKVEPSSLRKTLSTSMTFDSIPGSDSGATNSTNLISLFDCIANQGTITKSGLGSTKISDSATELYFQKLDNNTPADSLTAANSTTSQDVLYNANPTNSILSEYRALEFDAAALHNLLTQPLFRTWRHGMSRGSTHNSNDFLLRSLRARFQETVDGTEDSELGSNVDNSDFYDQDESSNTNTSKLVKRSGSSIMNSTTSTTNTTVSLTGSSENLTTKNAQIQEILASLEQRMKMLLGKACFTKNLDSNNEHLSDDLSNLDSVLQNLKFDQSDKSMVFVSNTITSTDPRKGIPATESGYEIKVATDNSHSVTIQRGTFVLHLNRPVPNLPLTNVTIRGVTGSIGEI